MCRKAFFVFTIVSLHSEVLTWQLILCFAEMISWEIDCFWSLYFLILQKLDEEEFTGPLNCNLKLNWEFHFCKNNIFPKVVYQVLLVFQFLRKKLSKSVFRPLQTFIWENSWKIFFWILSKLSIQNFLTEIKKHLTFFLLF